MFQKPKGYLPTLDGWRAVAIAGVLVAHGTEPIFGPGGSWVQPALYSVTRYGALGVDLFFGLSGFLICSRLLEEHEARGRISLVGFYIRRAFRIVPPYAAFLVTLAALSGLGVLGVGRAELASSVVFLRNYLVPAPPLGWYTGHLWSLAVEEHFYLLWPALLVFWRPERARARVVLLALAIAAWRVAEFRLEALGHVLPRLSFYERTDLRLDALLWGCWLALLVHHAPAAALLRRWLRGPGLALCGAVFVACAVASPPLGLLWRSVAIPLVIAGTALHPSNLLGRILESAPLRWLGRISYSLYLWQQLFLPPLAGWRSQLPAALQTFPLNVVLAVLAASASYYLLERPMMRIGHRVAAPASQGHG